MRLDASALRALNLVDMATMGVSRSASYTAACSLVPLGLIHSQFKSTRTSQQVQDRPGYSVARDMAQTAVGQHARNPSVVCSTFSLLDLSSVGREPTQSCGDIFQRFEREAHSAGQVLTVLWL